MLAEAWSAVSSSSGSGAAPVPLTLTGGFSLPFFTSNVPEDQQPVQELQALRSQPFYDWPELKVTG